ncbi:MAG: hypothetical protein AAF687_13905 [Pseudomonadota bacterium]
MSHTLLDQMRIVRGSCLLDGLRPKRWEMNQAAKNQLVYECDFYQFMTISSFEQTEFPPVLGIPVALIFDQTFDPRFALIVHEQELTLDHITERFLQ